MSTAWNTLSRSRGSEQPVIACLLLSLGLAAVLPRAAVAQMDPTVTAQGQVLSGMSRGYAERGYAAQRRSGALTPGHSTVGGTSSPVRKRYTAQQYCSSLPRFRKQYGAGDPRIVHLTELCRNAGL